MNKGYLRLTRKALRSLRHPRLKRLGWWRAATRPVARKELWIPYRDTVALGVTIGVFCSMIVVIPFQTFAAALICIRLGANLPLGMACCWISNPFTIAPLLWLQCLMGNWLRHDVGVPVPAFLSLDMLTIPTLGTVNTANFLLGMISFALICAVIAYAAVHLFAVLRPGYLPSRRHRHQTAD